MLAQQGITAAELIGNRERVKQIKASDFTDERFGLPTILDILSELEKPGRDPRGEFQTASFAEGIHEISDLQVGMILEGVVSNVANFGAFVDIGVHQDGLVHISALSNKFVQDPREVVKAGDVVKVKVLEVDAARKRIALTMRLDDEAGATKGNRPSESKHSERRDRKPQRNDRAPTNSAMADAFAKLKR
jgi:protein yhgF